MGELLHTGIALSVKPVLGLSTITTNYYTPKPQFHYLQQTAHNTEKIKTIHTLVQMFIKYLILSRLYSWYRGQQQTEPKKKKSYPYGT